MAKINVLEKHIAELIAAGEVVERPSSVIKELVENSVDAGAASITVEIKNGGVTYMRVTDNGCGIAREDVPTAFLRHATSKVHGQPDLDAIATLGFRGEALASIAAVARVELLTRTADDLAGTRYVIAGGEEEEYDDAGCAPGTTLVIRDIFYNTPARMKFLKKDMVEANSIASVVDKIALSHPEISFRFLRDGRETLHTPGDGSLRSAVYAVFGREFTQGLIPVSYDYQGVKLSGFISKPEAARPNRSMQHFFLNGRYVKSRTAMAALEEAFKGSLMVGKMPACVLHLEVPCNTVDVNVHPSKIEVRFLNERPIFDCVYHGVKTALNKGDTPHVMPIKQSPPRPAPAVLHDSVLPGFSPSRTAQSPDDGRMASLLAQPPEKEEEEPEVFVPVLHRSNSSPVYSEPKNQESPVKADLPVKPEQEEQPPVPVEASAIPAAVQKENRLVGEAFGTYIILERGKDELLFIDKHAAHERMLYEQLKAQSDTADQQLLLQPVTVTLDKNEYAAVLDALELFAKAGFEIEDFGAGTVLVRSAPLILGSDVAAAVMEMAGYLQNAKKDLTTERLDWLYHNVACRAAVKAGDESSPQELLALVERLEQNPDIRYCPHGRPVSIVIRRHDLEKNFGRIQ